MTGDLELLSGGRIGDPQFSRDGSRIFFQRGLNLWALSLEDGSERQLTDLVDASRQGGLAPLIGVTDEYLYFTWGYEVGDIWVMDVVQDEDDGSDN